MSSMNMGLSGKKFAGLQFAVFRLAGDRRGRRAYVAWLKARAACGVKIEEKVTKALRRGTRGSWRGEAPAGLGLAADPRELAKLRKGDKFLATSENPLCGPARRIPFRLSKKKLRKSLFPPGNLQLGA
jgi:hypothetical protein